MMFPKDKPEFKKEKDVLNINYGRRFPLYKNYLSLILLTFIIIVMLFPSDSNAKSFAIPFCIFIFLIILTANTGVKINLSNKMYKYYFSVFGISVGKWAKWSGYNSLVLKSSVKKRSRALTYDLIAVEPENENFKTTELYIMDANHRRKILCGSFDTYQEAKDFAKEVSELLNYPIEKFNPKRATRR